MHASKVQAGCRTGVCCSVYGLPADPQAQNMYKVESRKLIRYTLENSVLFQQAGLFRSVMDHLCVHGEPKLLSMHSAQAVRIVSREAHAVPSTNLTTFKACYKRYAGGYIFAIQAIMTQYGTQHQAEGCINKPYCETYSDSFASCHMSPDQRQVIFVEVCTVYAVWLICTVFACTASFLCISTNHPD